MLCQWLLGQRLVALVLFLSEIGVSSDDLGLSLLDAGWILHIEIEGAQTAEIRGFCKP